MFAHDPTTKDSDDGARTVGILKRPPLPSEIDAAPKDDGYPITHAVPIMYPNWATSYSPIWAEERTRQVLASMRSRTA